MKAFLCFGDSITFGRGELIEKGWVRHLKEFYAKKDEFNAVYNLGIPGGTTKELLGRLPTEAKARLRMYRPQNRYTILIAIGTNDSKLVLKNKKWVRKTKKEDFKKHARDLLKKVKKLTNDKIKAAVIGLTPAEENRTNPFEDTIFKNKDIRAYNAILKEQAKKQNLPFLNLYPKVRKENLTKILHDGLHPNKQGYKIMWKHIKAFLEKKNLFP